MESPDREILVGEMVWTRVTLRVSDEIFLIPPIPNFFNSFKKVMHSTRHPDILWSKLANVCGIVM